MKELNLNNLVNTKKELESINEFWEGIYQLYLHEDTDGIHIIDKCEEFAWDDEESTDRMIERIETAIRKDLETDDAGIECYCSGRWDVYAE